MLTLDLIALAATLLAGITIGRRLFAVLDGRWETEVPYELPASRPAVRVIPPVTDWESLKWF